MFRREVAGIPLALARQYLPRPRIAARQLRGVNAMLDFVRTHVEFYRRDARYAAESLTALDQLQGLPILDKTLLREESEQFLTDGLDLDACLTFRTSGTTGARVTVHHDRASHDYHTAALVRRFHATGRYRPTHRLAHIRPFAPPTRAYEKLGLFRRHVISTEQPMAAIKADLLAYRPHVIIGYPVHLRELLRSLTRAETGQIRAHLRLLMTESELLLPEHRADLSASFGVPVFDEYSAYEVLNITYDCPHGRAHVAEDRLVVETVDADGRAVPPNADGRVVITGFLERGMPLVRYDVGDLGRLDQEPCPCGRSFVTLRLKTGRSNDVVLLPGGRKLYGDTFLHLAATHPGLDECYVHQQANGLVDLHVIAAPGAEKQLLDSIPQRLFDIAGGRFDLRVLPAESMRIAPGGKGRFITSDYEAS